MGVDVKVPWSTMAPDSARGPFAALEVPMVRESSSPETEATETDVSRTSSLSTRDSTTASQDSALLRRSTSLRRNASRSSHAAPSDSEDLFVEAMSDLASEGSAETTTKSTTAFNSSVSPPPSTAETPLTQQRLQIKRLHSLLELLETERNYAEDLSLLVHVFFAELRQMPYFAEMPARYTTVVRNASALLALHEELAARLARVVDREGLRDTRQPEAVRAAAPGADTAIAALARAFIEFAPRFEVYNVFCSQHKEALAHIDTFETRTAEWDQFQNRTAEVLRRCQLRALPSEVSGPLTSPTRSGGKQRLLFRDFFIKPVQRLCLYPVILQTMDKCSLGAGHADLEDAAECMRRVLVNVDAASAQRQSKLLSEMIVTRLEPTLAFSPTLIPSLGECKMAGNLDMLYHHAKYAPLAAPLAVKYYGCMLYADFFLIVKVRKSHTFTPRFWFPLAEARLSRSDSGFLPQSFRLSVRGHHFELIASTAKERELWLSALESALQRGPAATRRLHGMDVPFPCSLPNDAAPSVDEPDPLSQFLLRYSNEDARGRPSNSAYTPTEILMRHKSPPRRAAADRGMLFSEACMSARASTEPDSYGRGAPALMSSRVSLGLLSGSQTSALRVLRSEDGDATPHVESPTPCVSPTIVSTDDERSLRRRVREAASRRSTSMDGSSTDNILAQELATALSSLSRRGSSAGLSMLRNGPPTEVGTARPSLSIDTAEATLRQARSRSLFARPKNWFSPGIVRSSSSMNIGETRVPSSSTRGDAASLSSSPVEPASMGGLDIARSPSSTNWSAFRTRNASSSSVRSQRSSIDLDDTVLSPSSTPGDTPSLSSSAPPSRPSSPRYRLARRFLQRNRLSSMASIGPS